MIWVLIVGVAWLAIAAVAALVIARAIRVADERQRSAADESVLLIEDDPHVPLRSDGLSAGPDDTVVPPPRPADSSARRPRGRRSVVRNPVPSSERTPHPHRSGAL